MSKIRAMLPENYWYMIEDGAKTSPLLFSTTSAYQYVLEHDFSPIAVIYWGVLVATEHPSHKSQKDFVQRGAMFLTDFIEVCAHG